MSKFQYRTVFLSDIHLGYAGVNAAELSAFLKYLDCERLYLAGDIIDLLALRSRWRWPVMHNQIVRRILKLAKKGVVVTFVPGNHDDALRQYVGLNLGGVKIALRAVHRTADGKMLLITHGDEFDLVVQHSKWLCWIGTQAYDYLIGLNRRVNAIRNFFGFKRWSFSHAVKARVKSACTYISNFEHMLLSEARRRGLDGVICGHIHQPELREVELDNWKGIYANCGDWLERSTALVEHFDGRLEIIDVDKLLVVHEVEIKRLADDPVALDLENVSEVLLDIE